MICFYSYPAFNTLCSLMGKKLKHITLKYKNMIKKVTCYELEVILTNASLKNMFSLPWYTSQPIQSGMTNLSSGKTAIENKKLCTTVH